MVAGERAGETVVAQEGRTVMQAEQFVSKMGSGAAKTAQVASKGGLSVTTTLSTKTNDIIINPEACRGASVDTTTLPKIIGFTHHEAG